MLLPRQLLLEWVALRWRADPRAAAEISWRRHDLGGFRQLGPHCTARAMHASSFSLPLHACDSGDGAMLLVSEAPTAGVVPLTAREPSAASTALHAASPSRSVRQLSHRQRHASTRHGQLLYIHSRWNSLWRVSVRLGLGSFQKPNRAFPSPAPARSLSRALGPRSRHLPLWSAVSVDEAETVDSARAERSGQERPAAVPLHSLGVLGVCRSSAQREQQQQRRREAMGGDRSSSRGRRSRRSTMALDLRRLERSSEGDCSSGRPLPLLCCPPALPPPAARRLNVAAAVSDGTPSGGAR